MEYIENRMVVDSEWEPMSEWPSVKEQRRREMRAYMEEEMEVDYEDERALYQIINQH